METLSNQKEVADLVTETANLKGVGTITTQGDKLVNLSVRFTDKMKADAGNMPTLDASKGSISFSVSKDSSEAPEKVNITLNTVDSQYRREVREEFNRLLDKYDGVTVISKEV